MTAVKQQSLGVSAAIVSGGAIGLLGLDILIDKNNSPKALEAPIHQEANTGLDSKGDQNLLTGVNITSKERESASTISPFIESPLIESETQNNNIINEKSVMMDSQLGRMVELQGGLMRIINPFTGEPAHETRYERIERVANDFFGLINDQREPINLKTFVETAQLGNLHSVLLPNGKPGPNSFQVVERYQDLGLIVGQNGAALYLLEESSGALLSEQWASKYNIKLVEDGIEYWGQNGADKPFFVYRINGTFGIKQP